MSRPLAVLRPEPGNAATVARIEALGRIALRLPLFAVHAIDWVVPDLDGFDALLLTSANAIRHGGAGLDTLKALPVIAVGAATARAAEQAGFAVLAVGEGNVEEAIVRAGDKRLLHLAGRELVRETGLTTCTVYASDVVPVDATRLAGCVALIHSPRAGRRLAEVALDRSQIAVAAISTAALTAAGTGWCAVAVARSPTDALLIAAAATLAD